MGLLDVQALAQKLAQVLPQAVDKMTPDGTLLKASVAPLRLHPTARTGGHAGQ